MNKEQPINIELAEILPDEGTETIQEPSVTEEKEAGVSENSALPFELDSLPSGEGEEETEEAKETKETEETEGEDVTDVETTAIGSILGKSSEGGKIDTLWIAVIVLGALVIALGASCIALLMKKKKEPKEQAPMPVMPVPETGSVQKEAEMAKQMQEFQTVADDQRKADSVCHGIGKVHNIGRRSGQQDSLGATTYRGGVLAVVADGMGGLSDGDKVSQKIVLTMMQDSASLVGGSTEGRLYQMVAHVNSEVNHMLGMSDQYKSGSTLIAVLVEAGCFQWISVGDSRIYLYRGQQLLQINREHVYEADLLQKAVNHEIGFGDIAQNPQKKSVSSFIGMGELKYIDGSMRPVKTRQGDRLLLMSDGVFNTLSEQEICSILSGEENAEKAARILENQVLARQNPKQDNFTAIILDI